MVGSPPGTSDYGRAKTSPSASNFASSNINGTSTTGVSQGLSSETSKTPPSQSTYDAETTQGDLSTVDASHLGSEMDSSIANLLETSTTDKTSSTSKQTLGSPTSPTERRRLFSCTLCPKKFFRLEHLTRHMRTHTGERPFSCSSCERRFSRSDELTRHLKTHRSDKKRGTDKSTSPSQVPEKQSPSLPTSTGAPQPEIVPGIHQDSPVRQRNIPQFPVGFAPGAQHPMGITGHSPYPQRGPGPQQMQPFSNAQYPKGTMTWPRPFKPGTAALNPGITPGMNPAFFYPGFMQGQGVHGTQPAQGQAFHPGQGMQQGQGIHPTQGIQQGQGIYPGHGIHLGHSTHPTQGFHSGHHPVHHPGHHPVHNIPTGHSNERQELRSRSGQDIPKNISHGIDHRFAQSLQQAVDKEIPQPQISSPISPVAPSVSPPSIHAHKKSLSSGVQPQLQRALSPNALPGIGHLSGQGHSLVTPYGYMPSLPLSGYSSHGSTSAPLFSGSSQIPGPLGSVSTNVDLTAPGSASVSPLASSAIPGPDPRIPSPTSPTTGRGPTQLPLYTEIPGRMQYPRSGPN